MARRRLHRAVFLGHARPLYSFTVWSGGKTGEVALRPRPDLARLLDQGDFTVAKVRDIRDEGDQKTWDIEVEEAHNFVVDGVVVHNSGGDRARADPDR